MEAHDSLHEIENESDNDEVGGPSQKKTRTRGHWTPVEDEKLTRLVTEHGAQNWNLVAEHLKGRTGSNENKQFFKCFIFIFCTI